MMETQTQEVKASLDDRIGILNRNTVEVTPAKQIFRTASGILALVRDKTIDNKDSVRLSEYCFSICEEVKTVIGGNNADGLNESVRIALEVSERVIREIERTLRRVANALHTKYNKKVVDHIPETQQMLGTLNTPGLSQNLSVGERAPNPTPFNAAITPVSENGCERLIRRALALHEFPSLIEAIFLNKDGGDTIRRLLRNDAQTFIDVIDEALDTPNLSPWARSKGLRLLYRASGYHKLLPRALKIPICYDPTGEASFRGGYADVWKGQHFGRDVAVKVLRTYSNGDYQKVVGRFCKEVVTWKFLRHPNVLPLIGVTMSGARFAMISDWMANGNINDFVGKHPDADRLGLLSGVAKGLIYIHSKGMIHGDLKGANILIDPAGHARLADFGLLTIISDPANFLSSSSYTQGGTVRWMSPELIAPQRFGLKKSRPTESSDCYALGMVIYETISGNPPFHKHTDFTVSLKVVEGKRPPRGVRFTESLWKTLELCWTPQPNDRLSIEDVLQHLEKASDSLEKPSPGMDEEMEEDGDGWDSANGSSDVSGGMDGMVMTGGSTTMSSDLSYLIDRPRTPILGHSMTLEAVSGGDVDILGHEVTDPDLLISRIDSNNGGTTLDFIIEAQRQVEGSALSYYGDRDATIPMQPKHSQQSSDEARSTPDKSSNETLYSPQKSMLRSPKLAPSAWQLYFTDFIQRAQANTTKKLNVAQAAKEAGQEYANLSAAEKDKYKRMSQAAKDARDKELAAYMRTLTPEDIKTENAFRTAQRKAGKSRRANMKDPNAPKKPLSAYFMFLQRIRSDPELVKEVFGDETETTKQSVLAAAKWRSMTDDEQKPFLAQAEQEKLDYEAARKLYENASIAYKSSINVGTT